VTAFEELRDNINNFVTEFSALLMMPPQILALTPDGNPELLSRK
jgi:hypothetical protein